MRTWMGRSLAALLAAGMLASVAFAADDDDDDAPKKKETGIKWGATGRFGKTPPAPPKKPDPPKEKDKDKEPRPPTAEVLAAARREREFNAYNRRMDACYRLMAIALANNDEEMQRQVEQLEERAFSIFQQNINSSSGIRTDETALSKELTPAGSERKLLRKAAPSGDTNTARSANDGREKP